MNLLQKKQGSKWLVWLLPHSLSLLLRLLHPVHLRQQIGTSVPHSSIVSYSLYMKAQAPDTIDECSYCHQNGHWKHVCPKRFQPKDEMLIIRLVLQLLGTTASSSPLATPTSCALLTPTSCSALPEFDFEQYRAYLVAIQGSSSQASAMSTTHSSLHGSSTVGILATPSSLHSSSTISILPATWIFDFGSSHHMTPYFSSYSLCAPYLPPASPISIVTANGYHMHVVSIRSIISTSFPFTVYS